MDEAQRAKIETAALHCLDTCRATDEPYSRVSAFIDSLKANPDWTADEIIEVQTQVIRTLLFSQSLRANLGSEDQRGASSARESWLGLSAIAALFLLLIVVVAMATFIGGGMMLRSQFRGLQQQREEAIKVLRQPPRIAPPDSD